MIVADSTRYLRPAPAPAHGRQHLGFAPGGPQDRFAAGCGNHLLGNDPDATVIEFAVVPPTLRFQQDCTFVLAGAPVRGRLAEGAAVDPWTVTTVDAGTVLRLEPAAYGLRTCFCALGGIEWLRDGAFRGKAGADPSRNGLRRPPFREVATWLPPAGTLRVLPGPEWDEADEPFLEGPWRVAPAWDDMGVRLVGPRVTRAAYDRPSGAVADGTVQMHSDISNSPRESMSPRHASTLLPELLSWVAS